VLIAYSEMRIDRAMADLLSGFTLSLSPTTNCY